MKNIRKSFYAIPVLILLVIFTSCEFDCASSEQCQLKPDAGPCFAAMPKYYYDTKEKRCKEFTYGGCGGVVPFQTMEECKQCECK
ncbi:proteinase inhibitor I4 serpin [Rhodocytophaga rosea]|uniref:Proteinase inhibitor I4 serpin n=1 Tax=Rhodocytophaga rosea TaxID=2704465 RepID=A0A6C0GPK8_9BACT|nr:BPTI/Kunitz domain-containing protein [Rhodocytophaga rosea]QHT69988.1 proteinase inhibitor I4 serpin [Rhodocytophaga rosea]